MILLKPMLRKTDIAKAFDIGFEKASKIFNIAKKVEKERGQDPYDLRPTMVSTKTVLEVMDLNLNFVLRQQKAALSNQEQPNSINVKRNI